MRRYDVDDILHLSGELFGSVVIGGLFAMLIAPSLGMMKLLGGGLGAVVALTSVIVLPLQVERFKTWRTMRRLRKTLKDDLNVLAVDLEDRTMTIRVFVKDETLPSVARLPEAFEGRRVRRMVRRPWGESDIWHGARTTPQRR